MLNFFSGKKRLLALLAVILIAIVIPLTVIVSRQQQEIRQRASGQQMSLYFASSGNCTPLTNPTKLTPNQSTPYSLCLSAGTHTEGISGFNITLSVSNSLTFQSASTTADADKFGSEPSPQIIDGNKTIHFTRILTSNNISGTPLRILDFAVLTTVEGNGSVSISTAEITSLTQNELLTVDNNDLFYNSTLSSSTPTPSYSDCSTTGCPQWYYCKTDVPTKFCAGCGIAGQLCCPGNVCQTGNICSDGIYCDALPTPTPTPARNCGTVTCNTGLVCLRNQIGEAGTRIDICVSPTPAPKKTAGQICVQTVECESGLTCEYYNEFGYFACTSPTPTPTPKIVAPIPTGPIKCTVGSEIYYCDQGFSCGGETDKACIENTPTPPALTRCTEFQHINTRVRKFKNKEVLFESINTCIRQFKGL